MPNNAADDDRDGSLGIRRAVDAGEEVQGWVAGPLEGEPSPPEIGLEVNDFGAQIVVAERLAGDEDGLPEGAWVFRWRPAATADHPVRIRAWSLATGNELRGSPLTLDSPGGSIQPSSDQGAAPPMGLWPAGLAGYAGASVPVDIASGLSVMAMAPARSLRFEMLARDGEADDAAPMRGVRLVADAISSRITAHFALPHPLPEPQNRLSVQAWLPVASEAAVQAHGELWLSLRENGRFVPVRMLRRGRVFRRAATLELDLTVSAEEHALGPLWLSIHVRDAIGLSVLSPVFDPPLSPRTEMEDTRLETSFGALAEYIRAHGEAAEHSVLLPPNTKPQATQPTGQNRNMSEHPFTQVILPIYNGGLIVRDCLRALRAAATGPLEVLIIDDGSRPYTTEMLRAEAESSDFFVLHRRDNNRGYTKSINEGVMLTSAPWVVVLNSDTLVSKGWLDRLHHAARERPGTGMVGPLSNAATWQSIPSVKQQDMSWSTNDIIEPHDVERVQALLAALSERAYPEYPVLNGFCTLISRAVFDRVGLYDEDAFPMGYGEETDLCLRARRAGFRLIVADDCFVFHHKSVSFGSENRSRLTRAGGLELTNKHVGINIAALEETMRSCKPLNRLRAAIDKALLEAPPCQV